MLSLYRGIILQLHFRKITTLLFFFLPRITLELSKYKYSMDSLWILIINYFVLPIQLDNNTDLTPMLFI